jgi:hypothetical protein
MAPDSQNLPWGVRPLADQLDLLGKNRVMTFDAAVREREKYHFLECRQLHQNYSVYHDF